MNKSHIDELFAGRADLLCFLVATLAASHSLTDEWRIDHAAESCRIWLKRNLVKMDWLDRVRIGQLALKIARRELKGAGIAVRQRDVQALFTSDMALNPASTVVQKMMKLARTRSEHRKQLKDNRRREADVLLSANSGGLSQVREDLRCSHGH